MGSKTKIALALSGVVLVATSCRQILDIEPGHMAAANGDGEGGSRAKTDGGDEAGIGVDGDGGTAGASTGSGGRSGGNGGDGGARAGSGGSRSSGGSGNPQGGRVGAGGTTDGDGGAVGGDGGATAVPLLPDAACAACFARNCSAQKAACENDPNCVSGVPAWLACAEPDSGTCTVADPGTLQDFERCGSRSCDFCQHLTDGKPSIEILSPSNGAAITVDSSNLVEVTVKVRNFTVQNLGLCGLNDHQCGHIHINLDGNNCHSNPFFNTYTGVADSDGIADTFANVAYCVSSVFGRSVELRASLSSNQNHADRIPVVESTIDVTLNQ